MELDKAIEKRHSSRKFKLTKKPDYREVIDAIDAATKIPLAGNLPALKFILVLDQEKIKKLAQAADQDFIETAPYVIVICSDKKFLQKSYYKRADMYSRQQAGAAVEHILLKLTDLGIDNCWIGAFSDITVKNLLKIPDDVDVEAMIPCGYEIGKQWTERRRKPALDRCLYFDTYKNRFMKPRRAPSD